jgi:hypothetical protein
MKSDNSETSGRFVKTSGVRPALELEWDGEPAADPAMTWTTGEFVKISPIRPALDLEWEEESTAPSPALELMLHPDPSVSTIQLALDLYDVIAAVERIERALGGTGLAKRSGQQVNGTVTLTLTPEQQAGASDRIQVICGRINRTTQAEEEFPLPAGVKEIRARVS